jgi:lysozyme family protein
MKKSNPQLAQISVSLAEIISSVVNSIPQNALNAIHTIIGVEGGNANDPDDHGGKTNFGISDLRDGKEDGLIDINLDGIGDVDPENLTREQAICIFYKDYWLANQCDKLPECIALIVFDIAVNQSAVFARKSLQRIIGATPDGIIGSNTLAKLNGISNSLVLHDLTKRRCLRYAKKVKDSSQHKQVKYLRGWLDRAFTVLFEAQSLNHIGENQ